MNGSTHNSLPQNGFAPAAPTAIAALDRRIDAAIERKPEPLIPSGFAAQVTLQLAARAARLPQPRRAGAFPIGRSIAWASAVLLAFALFVLAPHATPSLTSLSFDVEILVLLELAGVGWGLGRGFGERSSR
jgi:hypothetical protein